MYVPTFLPDPQTQVMFNDSIKNSCTLTFVSWMTDTKINTKGLEYSAKIGSAQNVNSPKCLLIAHQILANEGGANKQQDKANFDAVDNKRCFREIDGDRHPKDCVHVDYITNDYRDQNRKH